MQPVLWVQAPRGGPLQPHEGHVKAGASDLGPDSLHPGGPSTSRPPGPAKSSALDFLLHPACLPTPPPRDFCVVPSCCSGALPLPLCPSPPSLVGPGRPSGPQYHPPSIPLSGPLGLATPTFLRVTRRGLTPSVLNAQLPASRLTHCCMQPPSPSPSGLSVPPRAQPSGWQRGVLRPQQGRRGQRAYLLTSSEKRHRGVGGEREPPGTSGRGWGGWRGQAGE